jgi:hypothetical protein
VKRDINDRGRCRPLRVPEQHTAFLDSHRDRIDPRADLADAESTELHANMIPRMQSSRPASGVVRPRAVPCGKVSVEFTVTRIATGGLAQMGFT